MKLRYIGTGKLFGTIIGVVEGGQSYEVDEKIGNALLRKYPDAFKQVQEVTPEHNTMGSVDETK